MNARKRFTNNWQFLASAVFSKLEGNYDGTFQASTGQLDPNINSAFDYADFLVNADGPVEQRPERPAQVRRQLRVQQGRADGSQRRPVHALVLGHCR